MHNEGVKDVKVWSAEGTEYKNSKGGFFGSIHMDALKYPGLNEDIDFTCFQ